MNKIISADHSGTICNNKGIANKKQAKEFAASVQKIFEKYDTECKEANDFLNNKRDDFKCILMPERLMDTPLAPSFTADKTKVNGKTLYKLSGEFEAQVADPEMDCDLLIQNCIGVPTEITAKQGDKDKKISLEELYRFFVK